MNPHSLPTARKHRLQPTLTANGTNSSSIIGLVLIAIGYLPLVDQTPVQARRHRTGKTVVFSDQPFPLPESLKIPESGSEKPVVEISVRFSYASMSTSNPPQAVRRGG